MLDTLFPSAAELAMILPAVWLAVFGLAILLVDFLLAPRHKWINAVGALLGVSASGVALWRLRGVEPLGEAGFGGAIRVDPFFIFFGFLFLASTALVILLSARYLDIEGEHRGEYYSLLLFANVGMMFLASGVDMVVLFLALETMAICFYILTGYLRRDRRSNEAALKYLLLGAFSSGLLAYGFSILYGLSGSTNLLVVADAIQLRTADGIDVFVIVALVTTAAGLFFKIAAVPFHMWAPDVYEGAPTPVTAYVSVASKAASFALLLRVFLTAFWPVRLDWEMMFAIVAVATMTWGTLGALTQTNIKRLLAYSSIAHVGYILLGLVAANATGLQGMAFYLFVYAFMTTGAFAVVVLLRREGVIGDELEDMNGLIRRNPTAAILMLVFLISLAGIPPTAGFVGKYLIFLALIETGHIWLAIFGALYIIPAVYYYFRVIKHMWLTDASDPVRPVISPAQAVVLAATAFVSLAGLLWAEPFVQLARYATSALLPPFGP
jgi:NADH-quinone oxidoreductase subunit N